MESILYKFKYIDDGKSQCHYHNHLECNIGNPRVGKSDEMGNQWRCCHYHYGEQSHVVLRLENEEHDSDYINQNERVVKHSRARLVVDTLAEVVDDTR